MKTRAEIENRMAEIQGQQRDLLFEFNELKKQLKAAPPKQHPRVKQAKEREALIALLVENGVTRKEIAKAIGVTPSSVAKIYNRHLRRKKPPQS